MNKYTQDMTGTGEHVELPDPGPEPERYYDWMLWKLRQTPGWMKTVHGNYNNNYIYESPDKGKTIYRPSRREDSVTKGCCAI